MVVVYVDMVGDLFHAGHVNLLKRASALGSHLIVGVNSDEDVASYKRIPIVSLKNRATVIASCRYVNKVIAPCPLVITKEFLEENKIDWVVHAHDVDDQSYNFMYRVPMELGKFKRLDYSDFISTSQIIREIQTLILKQPVLQS